MPAPAVMWFRRDLRLGDHPALATALADHPGVVPLFVVDPLLAGRSGAPRLAFLHDCLAALHADTGGALVIRHGDPAEVVPAVAAEVGADVVYVTRDAGPHGRERDALVAARLRDADRRLRGVGSPYAVEPGTVRKESRTRRGAVEPEPGEPYAVFTPFFRSWRRERWQPLVDAPADPDWVSAPSDGLPARPDPGCQLPVAGERAALDTWTSFASAPLARYDEQRNLPGVDGTSRLSPHLKWGTVHPSRLLAELGDLDADDAHRVFASELAWREFYADVLFHRPTTSWENLNRGMDAMPVDTDAPARARFERWCTGSTGFPIVDAGMRELAATGWMHNRVRMIVASFLVKDLHLPWQWGARYFMRHLVDGDLASNSHGWQWTAGTGTDAAPYFRVFNPSAQAERYDPDGTYVARWVPEAGTPGAPAPMVDHAVERAEALRRYEAVRRR